MPKEMFMGRPSGSKNRPRVALPLEDALKELDSRTSQTVPMTAKIFGSTVGAVRRDISAGKLQAFQMGRLWFVPSVVIRRRISPPA
jgi:hypothetical protein